MRKFLLIVLLFLIVDNQVHLLALQLGMFPILRAYSESQPFLKVSRVYLEK